MNIPASSSMTLKRPLRIMQAHEFYGHYLDGFYRQHKEMALLPFDQQMTRFVADGFSAVHILTPYLRNLGCQTQFIILNCAQAQATWAYEHGLTLPADVVDTEAYILRAQIEEFKPDVLYLLGDYNRYGANFIGSLAHRPACIVGWRAADVPVETDWTGYDLILSSLPRMFSLAESLGAKRGVFFHPGMPSWISKAVQDIPHDTDVVFVGGISPTQHVRRHHLLDVLAKAATTHGFTLGLHLACDERLITPAMRPHLRPPVFGLDMHKALRRGKIVFDVQGTIGLRKPDGSYALDLAAGHTANMRLFEGTGGGSMVLTDDLAHLDELFAPGQEVAVFCDEHDMVSKIQYFLQHEEERKAIAEAGCRKCLADYNMKKVAARFGELIGAVVASSNL